MYVQLGQTSNAERAYEKLFKDKAMHQKFLDYHKFCNESEVEKREAEKQYSSRFTIKEILLIHILSEVRKLGQYFIHLNEGKIRVIRSLSMYQLLPIVKVLIHEAYKEWPDTFVMSTLAGISNYENVLTKDIADWRLRQSEKEKIAIARLCSNLKKDIMESR